MSSRKGWSPGRKSCESPVTAVACLQLSSNNTCSHDDSEKKRKFHGLLLGSVFVSLFIAIMVIASAYNSSNTIPTQKLFSEFLRSPSPSPPPTDSYPPIPQASLAKYATVITTPPGTVKITPNSTSNVDMISALLIRQWPIWYSNDDWPVLNQPNNYLYTKTEMCLFLEGKVTVGIAGSTAQPVTIQAGDFAVLLQGLDSLWTIIVPVKKYYYEF